MGPEPKEMDMSPGRLGMHFERYPLENSPQNKKCEQKSTGKPAKYKKRYVRVRGDGEQKSASIRKHYKHRQILVVD